MLLLYKHWWWFSKVGLKTVTKRQMHILPKEAVCGEFHDNILFALCVCVSGGQKEVARRIHLELFS